MIRAALILLAACASPQQSAAPEFPADNRWRGVPIHVWHTVDLDNDGGACQPYFLQPATLCIRSGEDWRYDGCSWHCMAIDMVEQPQ